MRGQLSDIVLAKIEIGKLVLLAEARLGELFNHMPKQQGGDRRSENFKLPAAGKFENTTTPKIETPKPKLEVAAEMGFNKNQVAQFQKLADNPDAVQKAIDDAQITAEQVTFAKIELGKRFNDLPKATNGGANQYGAKSTVVSNEQKPKSEVIAELGFTQKQAERFQQMAKNPDVVQAAMAKARDNGDVVSQAQILNEIKQTKRKEEIQKQAEEIEQKFVGL